MIFSAPLYGRVLAGRKTQTRRLVASGDLETKYRVGMRKAVQKGRGIHGEAHIILTDVRREPLGRIDFDGARAEGFDTRDAFAAYWVRLHDKAWLALAEKEAQAEAESLSIDADTFLEILILGRFDTRWAQKQVWVLTFELDHSEEPRFLMQGSPLTDGGKARVMTNKRRKPAKAKPREVTGPEETGYSASPARALSREPEPVDERTQDKFSLEGHQGFIARERARELDRELLAAEERLRLVRIDARAQGVDIAHLEAQIMGRVRAAERKVHGKAA